MTCLSRIRPARIAPLNRPDNRLLAQQSLFAHQPFHFPDNDDFLLHDSFAFHDFLAFYNPFAFDHFLAFDNPLPRSNGALPIGLGGRRGRGLPLAIRR